MEQRQPEGNNRYLKYIGLAVLVCITLVASIVVGVRAHHKKQAQDILEQLAAATWADFSEIPQKTEILSEDLVVEKDPIQILIERGIPIPEKEVDIAGLKEEVNEDIYAWIYIPDSQVDYPVLQHPSDNSYYLNYNIDGSKGYPGCIYTENYNAMDFSDPITVIYGHNMKNGSMFAGLHKFEDKEYFEDNPYIYIYTEDGLLVYEIFAAHEFGDGHILYNYEASGAADYQDYVEDIMETGSSNGNIREEVPVAADSRMITLSTCISGKSDRRYLVQAVLLNEN